MQSIQGMNWVYSTTPRPALDFQPPSFVHLTLLVIQLGSKTVWGTETLKCRDDSQRVKIIGVALTKSPIAAFTTRQHRAVSLDHERAVLTTNYLPQTHVTVQPH